MNGFNVSEACHIVNVLSPQSISGGLIGQAFSMSKAEHASILINFGVYGTALPTAILVSAGTATATVGTAVAGAVAIPFRWYYTGATGGATIDNLGAPLAATAAGILAAALTKSNIQMITIEIDSAELPDGSPWLQLSVTDSGNVTYMSAIAVLSGNRFQFQKGATATA